ITCKFGGTSLADAANIRIMQSIVEENPERRFVVPSAPGKRHDGDRKITDLLYAWHSIVTQGLDPAEPRRIISERFNSLAQDLGVAFDFEPHLEEIETRLASGDSVDFMAS